MAENDLDNVDRQILHCLQENARSISTESIGDEVGIAASTVRTRITKMEQAGVITGYHPKIDYDRAGYSFHYLFFCFVPSEERDEVVEEILAQVSGVIRVNELIDSELNVLVEAVATDAQHLDRINEQLQQHGLNIERGEVYKETHVQPFNFGSNTQK